MTDLLNKLLKKAKTDKPTLKALQNIAVQSQQYELAQQLRTMENNLFPESPQTKKAKEIDNAVRTIFGMVEVKIPEGMGWLVSETMKRYNKKKGEFSMRDAAELVTTQNRIFELPKK